MTYLNRLNDKQKEAVMSNAKYIRVVAGAGSGKTRVLTSRIIRLYKEGVDFRNVLGITFTNKAAKEMKNRVMDSFEGLIYPNIFTFHAFCVRILRQDGNVIDCGKDFNIIDVEDKEKLLKMILKEQDVDKEYLDHKTMASFISYLKTYYYDNEYNFKQGYNDNLLEKKHLIYKLYEERLKKIRSLDFDDLLLKTYQVLKKSSSTLLKWQERCKHILVDEFQDTNDLQFELVKFLVGKHNNLFVVGDPDQTIYTWRGANLKVIMDFEKYFPGSVTIVLNKNYRSTKQILASANVLIQNNKKRVPKDLTTDNDLGSDVTYFQALTQKEEAYKVVQLIRKHIKEDDMSNKDMAILYRANYLSREIEMTLANSGIKYRIFGGVRFYERKEVKDALAYLKILVNKNDDLSFLRVINEPRRGVGDVSLDKFKEEAMRKNISLFQSVKENPSLASRKDSIRSLEKLISIIDKYTGYVDEISISEILDNLLEDVGYYDMLKENDLEDKIENIQELINNSLYYENNNEEVSLLNFLQEIALFSAQDEIDDGNYVSLMTVHTAKGLEFPSVFVIGLSEGVFPSSRSLNDKDGEEEERRLAYVAFTRAQEFLHLSSNTDYSFISKSNKYPSRFLEEIAKTLPSDSKMNYKVEKKPLYNKKVINNVGFKNNIKWAVGDKVNHSSFGFGVILLIEGQFIKVAFKDPNIGIKRLLGSHNSISQV